MIVAPGMEDMGQTCALRQDEQWTLKRTWCFVLIIFCFGAYSAELTPGPVFKDHSWQCLENQTVLGIKSVSTIHKASALPPVLSGPQNLCLLVS